MSARLRLAGRVGLVALAAVGLGGPPSGGSAAVCSDTLNEHRTHRILLDGQGFDVLVHFDGRYVVAHSKGVLAVDACTLAAEVRCRDRFGARRLRLRDDGRVDYARPDGTVRTCDLSAGRSRPSALGELPPTPASRVWVDGDRALVRPASGEPRPLRLSEGALSVAASPDGTELAVGDRDGRITLYGAAGLPRGRYRAHGRNAYAVTYDAANGRILSVGGMGELALRRTPFTADR